MVLDFGFGIQGWWLRFGLMIVIYYVCKLAYNKLVELFPSFNG